MTFQERIQGPKPVLVDFYADWCGPCKVMAPVLVELKSRLGDKLGILKIDVDRNPSVSARYRISGIPTLILFKSGQPIWRQSGAIPLHELEKAIRAQLG